MTVLGSDKGQNWSRVGQTMDAGWQMDELFHVLLVCSKVVLKLLCFPILPRLVSTAALHGGASLFHH